MIPHLQKYDVVEGSDILVNLSATGNPSSITYTWFKDAVPLLDLSESFTKKILPNSNVHHHQHHHHQYHQHRQSDQHQLLYRGSVLEIKSVSRDDAGEYECEASNNQGSSRRTIFINVLCKWMYKKEIRIVI